MKSSISVGKKTSPNEKKNVSLNEEMLTVNLHVALKNALGASNPGL